MDKKIFAAAELFDLSHTLAAPLLEKYEYPWQCLPGLSAFITELGGTLDPERFDHPSEGVWIAKSATVAPTAFIGAPCIVDEEAEILSVSGLHGYPSFQPEGLDFLFHDGQHAFGEVHSGNMCPGKRLGDGDGEVSRPACQVQDLWFGKFTDRSLSLSKGPEGLPSPGLVHVE